MTEKEIYIEIAQRYIQCCQQQLTHNINYQESIGFNTYHAFESIAGAVNCHLGHPILGSHAKKLNSLIINYRNNRFASINPKTLATLAIVLSSMRNKFLYPHKSLVGMIAPSEQISITQARQLTSQINGIITRLVSAM